MSSRRCCGPPALACHVRLAPTCARSRAHTPCAPRFRRIRNSRPSQPSPTAGQDSSPEIPACEPDLARRETVAKGTGITFGFLYIRMLIAVRFIRICYDSHIRIYSPRIAICASPRNSHAGAIQCASTPARQRNFLFRNKRLLRLSKLKSIHSHAAERLMRWITRCRPNRLRSRPSNP